MKHLRYILIHPSKIGLFHKDNFIVVILCFILFSALLLGALALKVFNTSYFNNQDYDYVINLVEQNGKNKNTEYANFNFHGEAITIKDSSFECYILTGDENSIKNSGLNLFFKNTEVSVFYHFRLLGRFNYTELGKDISFKVNELNISNENYNFRILLDFIFTNVNRAYASTVYLSNVLSIYQYYLIFCLVVSLIYSYFSNPSIKFDVRSKLVIYDSLIYFFILFFMVSFDIGFLQYVAIFFPIIYCGITFSHIIRVQR